MKKLSAKQPNGKWWSYGRLETNKWGNEQVSFKRENLVKLLEDTEGEWINLSLFDDDRKDLPKQDSNANYETQKPYELEQDDIPF